MQVTWVPMTAQVVCTILHFGWLYLLVTYLGMEIKGVALATFLTYFSQFIFVEIYGLFVPEVRAAMFFPTKESFREWGSYLKLSIPSTLMLCAEWWAFEVLILLAGYIGVVEQAAQILLFNMIALMFMVALGMQEATCALVGNSVGENNIPQAKRFFRISFAISSMAIILVIVLVFFTREQITRLYTNEELVVQTTVKTIPLLCIQFLWDGTQGYLQGVIRGLGLQGKAAIICLACYYLIAIPLAYVFAFVCELGNTGLVMGVMCGGFVQAASYLALVLKSDWQRVADESLKRIENQRALLDLNE